MSQDPVSRARQLRVDQTRSEGLLWSILRARQLCGLKFRRQYFIDPYFADFACVDKSLIVEIDGDAHDHKTQNDLDRQNYLAALGWDILRFEAKDVERDAEVVARGIATHLGLGYQYIPRKSSASGMKARRRK